MRDNPGSRLIGRRLPRREDGRLLTGEGRFSDDFNLPGQCYAQFVRSPYAHAGIGRIDTGEAVQSPGVVSILTGREWQADGHANIFHVADPADGCDPETKTFADRGGFVFDDGQPVIATDKARHVGEPVAIVVAESVEAAKDAAEMVMVDYDEQPAASTMASALAGDAGRIWDGAPGNVCLDTLMWDEESVVEAAFAEAAHVIERSFTNNRVAGCQMEPRSGVGDYDAGAGRYFLYAGSQGSIRLKNGLMRVFGVPADKVRVVSEDVGGGFGPRNFLYPDFALLTWAARRTGPAGQVDIDARRGIPERYPGPRQRPEARARVGRGAPPPGRKAGFSGQYRRRAGFLRTGAERRSAVYLRIPRTRWPVRGFAVC